MEITYLKIEQLEGNKGQIEGVPRNPRKWKKNEVEAIAKSLRETPELFAARPIIVVPVKDKYIAVGGNLRLQGCIKNGDTEVPCFILPENTPAEKIKEIVIKDNGSFGQWDYDLMAEDWGDLPLSDWGVLAKDVKEMEKRAEKDDEDDDPDMEFVKLFNEKQDYVLLTFDNEVDWLQIESILPFKIQRKYPTKKGEQSKAFKKQWKGVSRVFDGPTAIRLIMEAGKNS